MTTPGGVLTIGVAVAVPGSYGAELQAWRERFGDPEARCIPSHVTLLPPTEVSRSELPTVEWHLAEVAAGERPFRIRLRGTGTFRPVSPVVFVQLAEGIPGCERVERAVRSGPLLRELRFPYHPHVTVAHDLPADMLDNAFDKLASYEAQFSVDGFSLYEHGPDGVWRPRRVFGFGGAPGRPGTGAGA